MPLSDIRDRIAAAEARAGRAAGSVKLIAVSKVQPLARIEAVLAEGHRLFGENRVQEAAGKWPGFREQDSLWPQKCKKASDLMRALLRI